MIYRSTSVPEHGNPNPPLSLRTEIISRRHLACLSIPQITRQNAVGTVIDGLPKRLGAVTVGYQRH